MSVVPAAVGGLRLEAKKLKIRMGSCRTCFTLAATYESSNVCQDKAWCRPELSWTAVEELGYFGAKIARYLGVTSSCVTRIVAFGTKPPVEELIKEL